MIINKAELENIIKTYQDNPEKAIELIENFKLVSASFEKDDGIPPRFGSNFREEGPVWEKVTGIDFEIIGRILVCHLCIEHYIDNLIILSTPIIFDWDKSRMTFSQKLKLINKISFLEKSNFIRGIEILNSIRNELSHNMLAKIEDSKFNQLKEILMNHLNKNKSPKEKDKITKHMNLYSQIALIEQFTGIVCAMIAGNCTSLINKEIDPEIYTSYVRNAD